MENRNFVIENGAKQNILVPGGKRIMWMALAE
jgi:hypothetical protein